MTRVAILEYWTSSSDILIFLIKHGLEHPLVYRAQASKKAPVITQDDLIQCVERLFIDFHGLPAGWDERACITHFQQLLSLPPKVHSVRRRQPISTTRLKKTQLAYTMAYWENLSQALLPTALKEQLTDCDMLCIVPHGPLHSLPFAALRWSEHEYLIERFGLCFVPSASILRYCQIRNRKRTIGEQYHPASCLVVAVASRDDPQPQDFEADGDTLTQLFSTQIEQARVQKLIGIQQASNPYPASKKNLLQGIQGHDIIHMACHGIFGMGGKNGNSLDSGLLLSDGISRSPLLSIEHLSPIQLQNAFLSAREVFSLNLSATNLVTLRACSSGRTEVASGDELLGLTRAFLFAGASSLIVSLWNTNILSSKQLLNNFYRLWLSSPHSLPKWQALQQAQKIILQQAEYAHPYHWAPFVLVGDWL